MDDAPSVYATAVETLSLAFCDDPLQRWLFEDDATRLDQLRQWWRWIIDHRPGHTEVVESQDRHSAAIWYGPDPVDADRRSTFPDMLIGLLGRDVALTKLEGLGVITASHPNSRHWYLGAIGTRPEFQGLGGGARLLAPALARCDAGALPAYLESSNARNVPFYERLGFTTVGEIRIPGGPSLTPMWREPRATS